MTKGYKAALLAAALLAAPILPLARPVLAQAPKPAFAQGSMNIFRRFPAEIRSQMLDYYGKVLGLQSLQPIQLTATQQMILFRVGATGQIKLASGLTPGRKYHPGGAVGDATGIRFFTLYYPDEAAVTARFTAAGLPAPAFKDISGGRRAALVQDPGGFNLELIIDPKASPATTGGVDVGINVTDLARSRAFYRDFAGLDELPAVKDPLLGMTKYPFRHGETTLSLFSVGKNLPQDTGSAGIQYVTTNVAAMNDRAKAENVTVETPFGGVPGFNVLTVWLNDPDGVTNYFYQMGPRPAGSRPAGSPGAPAPAPTGN